MNVPSLSPVYDRYTTALIQVLQGFNQDLHNRINYVITPNMNDFNRVPIHPKITLPLHFTSEDFEHFIKTVFNVKTFWLYYRQVKSKGDGFCILNSLVLCLNSLYDARLNNDILLYRLVNLYLYCNWQSGV